MNQAHVSRQLLAVRQAQRSVEAQLEQVRSQLKEAEKYPDSQPWVSMRRTRRVEELRSPFRNVNQALQHDLRALKRELTDLKREAKNLKNAVPRQRAVQASRDFKRRLEQTLREAERDGALDPGTLESLLGDAEGVLNGWVVVLDGNASPKNIKSVLTELEIPLLLGCDMDQGACQAAWASVRRAVERVVAKADEDFRRRPTLGRFDTLVAMETVRQQVGGVARELPADLTPAEATHTVERGDTLSTLSQQYYGSPSYWDVIYIENYSAIGDDPDKLIVRQELTIP